ncbi:MAG: hypothetical protein Q4D51_05855 [Eubacteriales bacterium]|nr:hypothetical protein [Eubacteriales bacterium]
MSEKLAEVFEMYDMEVLGTRKGRGATILSTSEGVRILEPFRGNMIRLEQEYVLKQLLVENGFCNVDVILPNRDGILFTCDRYRQPFVLKKHFEGEECDMYNWEDMKQSISLLAQFHKCGKKVAKKFDQAWKDNRIAQEKKRLAEIRNAVENGEELERIARIYDIRENILREMLELGENAIEEQTVKSSDYNPEMHVEDLFVKHNRELMKIYKHVMKVKRKNAFEMLFLKEFKKYYEQGKYCVEQLESTCSVSFCQVEKEHFGICHGAYNQHNIILHEEQGAIVHFERFSKGNQLHDLYQFTRKAMEKNHFDVALLTELLATYSAHIPLSEEDYRYIYILFSYPEKFWKIANGYYNTNKSFLSPKHVEKLKNVICQEEEKQKMLQEYWAFHFSPDSV